MEAHDQQFIMERIQQLQELEAIKNTHTISEYPGHILFFKKLKEIRAHDTANTQRHPSFNQSIIERHKNALALALIANAT